MNFSRPDGSADPALAVTLVADANSSGENDQLTINFPAATLYSFGGTDGNGTFTFGVHNVSDFRNGSHTDTVDLIGDITGAKLNAATTDTSPVPEPSSIVLLCSALGAVAFKTKRKARQNIATPNVWLKLIAL